MLPNTWSGLYLAAMRDTSWSSAATAHLTVFVSNVDGRLQRADWIERCFDQCEEVVDSACFLHSGQKLENTMAESREISFDKVIRAAFAAVLTVDEAVDDEKISQCLSSWQWRSGKEQSVQTSLYSVARL